MRRLGPSLVLALALGAEAAAAPDVPTPDAVLGITLGADRTLADWDQEVRYFKALGRASDRVRVDEAGKTTEGRPFLIVTITSAANMARLEEIREANLALWDPRGLAEPEAEKLIARGKTIVALNHGIHSTEVAASQTAMETAHALATGEDPWTREVLDETVIVMIPSQNPDGMQRVTEWYRKTLGTPFEGASPPFLYHRYAGHDNNRDWYMFALEESRLTVRHLHDRWRPHIVHDLHQMGEKAARIFLPPYLDPFDPNVDPALQAATAALGTHMAARLLGEGKTGVVVQAIYDAWSPSRAYPFTHGGVRLLSECASAKLATPIEMPFASLEAGIGYDPKRAAWNFPAPWRGGPWRLRDIMDYQRTATRALLEHAAKNREFWLRNFLQVNRRASARQEPFAFVIPAEQRDPLATAKLVGVMRMGAVEVLRAAAPFEAAGRTFVAGSHVILMQQPASAFAKTLLEAQQYPEVRPHAAAPLVEPYDMTAHTLPLLLGVKVVVAPAPFLADLEPVGSAAVAPSSVEGRGALFALGHGNAELIALGRLLRSGVTVRWTKAAFRDRGRDCPAGTLLVPGSARGMLAALARELGFTARAVLAAPVPALVVRRPRVGLYESHVPAMDAGWTRYVFDHDAGVAYDILKDRDIRAGRLSSRFDAIVLPSQPPKEIVEGHAPGTLPEELTGGIGEGGVAALKAFVLDGGTLVALNAAANLPIEDFDLPVAKAQDVTAPGSILRVSVDPSSLLAHGLEATASIWFEKSPAFDLRGGNAVFRYTEPSPLLAGFLLGGEKLVGKAALVEVPLGKGRVVLFGFRPQYRAQAWATYVPLLNAIYSSAAR